MSDIFQQYAKYALSLDEGTKPPPKPKKPSKALYLESSFGGLFAEAKKHFIDEHETIFPEAVNTRLDKEFDKLYDIGVFQFSANLKEQGLPLIGLSVVIWDGKEYVDINQAMHEIFDFSDILENS